MKSMFRLLVVALPALLLLACHAPASSEAGHAGTSSAQIRLYKVPAGQSQQIAGALGVLLAGNGKNDMGVTQPFPGTLMVLAPSGVQASIASAIESLAKASPAAAAPMQLHVQFWVVQAMAGAGADSAALQPLAGTLDALRGSLGPSHFALEDTAALQVNAPNDSDTTTGNGQLTTARGHEFGFHARMLDAGDVALDMHYSNATRDAADRSIPEMRTTVAVKPGTYVVLAQAPPAARPPAATDAALMNLLVVRVDRAAPAAH